jgi:hypothetical protein
MTITTQSRKDLTSALDTLDTRRHEVANGQFTDGANSSAITCELNELDAVIECIQGIL